MKTLRAEPVLDCRNTLGEGIIWSVEERCLYWTDIESRMLWRYDPDRKAARSWKLKAKIGSLSFRRYGGLLLAFERELCGYDPATGSELPIARVEGRDPAVRLNDGRCDRDGRFIVGEFDYDGKGRGSAWSLHPDGSLHHLFGGLDSANSTCFSPDGDIMYFADSPRKEIRAYRYDREAGVPGEGYAVLPAQKTVRGCRTDRSSTPRDSSGTRNGRGAGSCGTRPTARRTASSRFPPTIPPAWRSADPV